MPLGGKLSDCNDLAIWRDLRDSPLTSSYDKVISRHWVSLDSRRLEFFSFDVLREFNDRYYSMCIFSYLFLVN